ncbi:TIGR03576 family pyridoxal phosphate-dependent enzyme [Methanobacterium formicicum]|uniref:Pyridoxal phosphate enzyme n=1 Tax=Methanobacterium formicicum (strain DSM 3637 / PP1) TaxID=1204725 RepID=K2R430_METFP|nr:TIGR03576 family pyridoxal phosphate-dependent enzyme [Methanobacterium formicicum]EKF85962.1 pyridoxal phosphate enzyme [Methanobacterium formicicum DSM 3637]
MLICSSLDEVKRREAAFRFIATTVNHEGRSSLYDLSGLAGGFPVKKSDLPFLETYSGPAIFELSLQKEGKKHLGGEKVAAFNRTSAAILATILALVKHGEEVLHYLPELPSHPSIPRSAKLQGASYAEFDNIGDFQLSEKTSLVVITGSTMDHQVIPLDDFEKIIQISHKKQIPVLVDDASGARIRTVIYNQPRALDMGADLVVTSTDKLMNGPRAGLMAGKTELINQIKDKSHQFGLEAQPPIVAGIVRALEAFNPQKLLNSMDRRDKLSIMVGNVLSGVKKTPTGFMISASNLKKEIIPHELDGSLSDRECATLMAMVLLKEHHIITIPALGMPGVSTTIRFDLSAADAENLDDTQIVHAIKDSIKRVREMIADEETCLNVLYE